MAGGFDKNKVGPVDGDGFGFTGALGCLDVPQGIVSSCGIL
jgi:hypothetical protein